MLPLPIAWMAHPLSGDVPGNLARAKRWLGWLYRTFDTVDFAADWIPCCEVLDDNDPANRERGLCFDEQMIRRLDQYWMVGGRVSSGMARERATAVKYNKLVVDLTMLGPEPPAAPFDPDKLVITCPKCDSLHKFRLLLDGSH